MAKKHPKKRRLHLKRLLLSLVVGVVVFVLAVLVAFRVSPWPGALVIRAVFNRGGHKTLVGLQQSIPAQPVNVVRDQKYGKSDDELLDVYIPNRVLQTSQMLPIVIWTHGGAWLSGNKKDSAPYYNLLANQGYVVVALNYSLAPGSKYPTQLIQLNDAYNYLLANASHFHSNTDKIVLAGDSAGAQLSSEMAAIVTNPEYAKEVGIKPTLKPSQLVGTILFCGIYKMEGLVEPDATLPKIVSWGDDTAVWSYLGVRNRAGPLVRQSSSYYHVTHAFPAVFISGGNGDPLTTAQSVPLSQKLIGLGVPVTTLFYPQNHQPSLPHEYQFHLNSDGKNAFMQMTQFLRERTQ